MVTNRHEIVLPDELERFVGDGVASGRFADVNAAIVTALGRLASQQAAHDAWKQDLREKIAEGYASAQRGDLIEGDIAMADIRDRLIRKYGDAFA